jgi:hypothetical protein
VYSKREITKRGMRNFLAEYVSARKVPIYRAAEPGLKAAACGL